MKTSIFAILATITAAAAAPSQAVVIAPGTADIAPQAFTTIAGTQGTLLASKTVAGSAFTFATSVNAAVYRNTFGTLDFYYQVSRTGRGTLAGAAGNQMIDKFTASDFLGFTVDGYASAGDPDAGGFFRAANNLPSSTTTFGRSTDGAVIQLDFGTNGLAGTEVSATYVFRTNARAFTQGTFGVIDGSSFSGLAFSPTAGPEPATWGLMVGGFAMVGFAARRRNKTVAA